MPLVRIDLETGRTDEEIRLLADVVQECMLDVFAAPPRDRYQVITEHPPGRIILEDTGLGYERTSQQVVIHVFQQGGPPSRSRRCTPCSPSAWRSGAACAGRTSWSPSPRWAATTGRSGSAARSS